MRNTIILAVLLVCLFGVSESATWAEKTNAAGFKQKYGRAAYHRFCKTKEVPSLKNCWYDEQKCARHCCHLQNNDANDVIISSAHWYGCPTASRRFQNSCSCNSRGQCGCVGR